MSNPKDVIAQFLSDFSYERDTINWRDVEGSLIQALKDAGFVILPAQVTEAMLEAGHRESGSSIVALLTYRAMVKAYDDGK